MNNPPITTLGWDVGGAHLKAAMIDAHGRVLHVIQLPCALWRGLNMLDESVAIVMQSLAANDARHVVTMTGELADIFPDRLAGVEQLADRMTRHIPSSRTCFYAGRAGLVAREAVADHAGDIASANWHASAAFVAQQVQDGLFIDIGSTTADIIPLKAGVPAARGYSDAERMRFDELVYTGVVRTPIMAIARHVPFAGEMQRLAAEHFATTADIYRLTGDLTPDFDMAETADGQGKSIADSARRLARMVGRDLSEGTERQWRMLAESLKHRQLHTLQLAVARILSIAMLLENAPVIGAGAGSFLARELARIIDRPYMNAVDLVDTDAVVTGRTGLCFPAYAVARLSLQNMVQSC